jgi:hypothetical protein
MRSSRSWCRAEHKPAILPARSILSGVSPASPRSGAGGGRGSWSSDPVQQDDDDFLVYPFDKFDRPPHLKAILFGRLPVMQREEQLLFQFKDADS